MICCLYQNKLSDKVQLYLFQEFTIMSKINHTKKVIEDLNVYRKYFRVRQEVSDEIQTIVYFIKDELQTSIENIISCNKRKEKSFWSFRDGLKMFLTMNPMEKQITKMNTTSENMTYLVDNSFFCVNIKKFTH